MSATQSRRQHGKRQIGTQSTIPGRDTSHQNHKSKSKSLFISHVSRHLKRTEEIQVECAGKAKVRKARDSRQKMKLLRSSFDGGRTSVFW